MSTTLNITTPAYITYGKNVSTQPIMNTMYHVREQKFIAGAKRREENAKPAEPIDIIEAERLIRKHIAKLYGKDIAEEISILYGGSVNKDTAAGYLEIDGIDGLLIGSARLIADQFCAILEIAKGVKNER